MKTSEQPSNIISIVTPSLNQGEFIEETIRSVLSQAGEFYIDYIIIDGGSMDDTVDVIALHERLLRQNCDVMEHSGLRFFVPKGNGFEWNRCLGISYRWWSEPDRGQSDAVNKGLHAARGYVSAFLNSDDLYFPGAIRKVLALDWSEMDFVFGEGMWISRAGRDLLYYPTRKPSKYSMYYQCTLCQPAVFFRQDTFNRLGDFSLEYDSAFDYEYWLRALSHGCTFKFLREPLARSRMHADNKSLSAKSRNLEEVEKLKKSYYSGDAEQLSAPRLWANFCSVHLATHWRVNRLKKLLIKYQ